MGYLGQRFDAAAELIGKAVQSLPAQIQTSIVNLSADVARGINEDLKHQLEYLKKIAVIYGDQQLTVAEVHSYVREVAESVAKSASAVSKLEGSPEAIRALAGAVARFEEVVGVMRSEASVLAAKVDRLPAEEISKSAASVERLATTVGPALEQLRATSAELDKRIHSSLSEAHTEQLKTIRAELEQSMSAVEAAVTSVEKNEASYLAKLQAELTTTGNVLSGLSAMLARLPQASFGNIEQQLTHISNELGRVPKWRRG